MLRPVDLSLLPYLVPQPIWHEVAKFAIGAGECKEHHDSAQQHQLNGRRLGRDCDWSGQRLIGGKGLLVGRGRHRISYDNRVEVGIVKLQIVIR